MGFTTGEQIKQPYLETVFGRKDKARLFSLMVRIREQKATYLSTLSVSTRQR
jgi:hypothetical protein